MQYVLEFELCSLLFLLALTVRFFEMRRFPNAENRLFGFIMICAIADILLDIIASLTIEYANEVPAWVNYAVNTTFYALQIVFPSLIMLYVLVISGLLREKKRQALLLLIPDVVFILLLIANLFTPIMFYIPVVNGVRIYTRGLFFNHMYISSVFYMGVSVYLVIRYRALLQKKQITTILCFIFIIIIAMYLQYIMPQYLLTGVAMTMAILLMFFTLQNPNDMLDQITGVFNYNAMMAVLSDMIRDKHRLRLVVVDVGGIRRINSSLGVKVGNEVLGQIGEYLNGIVSGIWAFRMIGTRFLLVARNAEEYQLAIDGVRDRFAKPWKVGDRELVLIATVRYFNEPDFFETAEDVVNLIDVSYSEIQGDGWGKMSNISVALLEHSRQKLLVENTVRDVLESGEGFSLVYQPIYSPGRKCFSGAEVLLRLDKNKCGNVTLVEFINVAEKTGLIPHMDELVIKTACKFMSSLSDELLEAMGTLEINLSAAEFLKNSHEHIHRIVTESNADPCRICFEVTETAATVHPAILAEFMLDMINEGYSFALDDFGTGYANLTQVTSYPFSIVKLDRSMLVSNVEKNVILFDNLLTTFSQMGIKVVVEGVETREQAERAMNLGADYIQGFLFAHPLSEAEYVAFLKRISAADRAANRVEHV